MTVMIYKFRTIKGRPPKSGAAATRRHQDRYNVKEPKIVEEKESISPPGTRVHADRPLPGLRTGSVNVPHEQHCDPYVVLIAAMLRQAVDDASASRRLPSMSPSWQGHDGQAPPHIGLLIQATAREFLYNGDGDLEMWCGLANTDFEKMQRALLQAAGLPHIA